METRSRSKVLVKSATVTDVDEKRSTSKSHNNGTIDVHKSLKSASQNKNDEIFDSISLSSTNNKHMLCHDGAY